MAITKMYSLLKVGGTKILTVLTPLGRLEGLRVGQDQLLGRFE
jgi:hypothetical protein